MESETGSTLTVVILLALIAVVVGFLVRARRRHGGGDHARTERHDASTGVSAYGADAARTGTPAAPSGAGDAAQARVAAARDASLAEDYGPASAGATSRALGERAPDAPSATDRDAFDASRDGHPPAERPFGRPSDPAESDADSFEAVKDVRVEPAAAALTEARASRLGVSAAPAAPDIGTTAGTDDTDAGRDPDGPVAFAAPDVGFTATEGELRSQGGGPDADGGAPPLDTGDRPRSNADDAGRQSGSSTADGDVSGGGDDTWASRASSNVSDDATASSASDVGDTPAVPLVTTARGTGAGVAPTGTSRDGGSWSSHAVGDDGRPATSGAESSGRAQTGADPSVPVPASDAAIREPHGSPPSSNTSAGAAVADAGPTDARPDDERANLPDPAVAGGLDGLRPPPSTGERTGRATTDLPSARPALEGDFAVRGTDRADNAREMLKILNLREADATRLGLSADEYRSVRGGDASALSDERLDALLSRLAGMMV